MLLGGKSTRRGVYRRPPVRNDALIEQYSTFQSLADSTHMVGVGMDQLDNPFKAIIHVPLRLLRKAAKIPLSKKGGGKLFRDATIGDPAEENRATHTPIDVDDSDEEVDVD